MPVLLAGREPDHVSRPNLLDRLALVLHPAQAGRHVQCLAQRVRVPRGARAWLKGDQGTGDTGGLFGTERLIEPHRAGEPVLVTAGRWLRSIARDLHLHIVSRSEDGCASRRRYDEEAMRRVHILTTGGTMEKRYIEQNGEMRNTEPQIARCLKLLRLPEVEVTMEQLMNKDSLDMTDADRECIADHVAAAAARGLPVLVTHGTDTVVDTGKVVAARLPDLATPVVFTGAMTPFGIEGSDAMSTLR